jgi:hypothetical protein
MVLRPKNIEITKTRENCARAQKPNTVPEIEPNPSKDRAMPEGDNPSF